MKSAENDRSFPVWLPWEDFTENAVTIEELRERVELSEHRSFLVSVGNPAAPVLNRAALSKLLNTLDLAEAQRADLERDLSAIGVWYLTPASQVVADADIDATRKYLRALKSQSASIGPALRHVLSMMPNAIEHHLKEKTLEMPGVTVDVFAVKDFMKHLPALCDLMLQDVSPKQVGRRRNFVLDHAARLTRDALDRARLSVKAKLRNASGELPHLTGPGAQSMWDYFKMLSPRLGESELVRALIRVQGVVKPNAPLVKRARIKGPVCLVPASPLRRSATSIRRRR